MNEIFILNEAGSEYMIHGVANGAVKLYYDNSPKLETTTNGATVTGTLSGTDPEGDTLTYSIAGSIEVDGVYTATGTYGTLVVNKTTGEFSIKSLATMKACAMPSGLS